MRNWLCKKRKERKMTHKEVASKCNITRQFYSMIENGNRRPSVEIAKSIAEVLEFEWTEFFEKGEKQSA